MLILASDGMPSVAKDELEYAQYPSESQERPYCLLNILVAECFPPA